MYTYAIKQKITPQLYLNSLVSIVFFSVGVFFVLFLLSTSHAQASHCGGTFEEIGFFFEDFEEVEYSEDGFLILHLKLRTFHGGRTFILERIIVDDECRNDFSVLRIDPGISIAPDIQFFSIRFASSTHFDIWNDEDNVMETCSSCSQDFPLFPGYFEFAVEGSITSNFDNFSSSYNRISINAQNAPIRKETLPLQEGCLSPSVSGYLFDEYESVEYVDGLLRYHFRFRTPFNDGRAWGSHMFLGGESCIVAAPFFPKTNTKLPAYVRYYSVRFSSNTHYDIWSDETNEIIACPKCSVDISETAPNGERVKHVRFRGFIDGGGSTLFSSSFPILESDYIGESVSPRVLQYEPILLLHPEENYQPMNVEAFVEASSLWSTAGVGDTLIKAESAIDPVTLHNISEGITSSDWYLQYSGGSITPKTFSTTTALLKYKVATVTGEAVPTYYSYEMEDSFTDDEGILHEFIVLQYWYFYAFNDWDEHGGFNNHEGDWETVMVFLDKVTEEPMYVAYSAHHNDDDPNLNPFQYASVRRDWDAAEKEVNKVKSYVALGSHANYPNNGNAGEHTIPFFPSDFTSVVGEQLATNFWVNKDPISSASPNWVADYKGLWGSDVGGIGAHGPQGPNFNDVSGIVRFNHPVEWAGIDNVFEKEVVEPTFNLSFATSQSTVMHFEEPILAGSVIEIDFHEEFIAFGNDLDTITFLPYFWDLESNLGETLPTTTVTLGYSPEDVENLDIIEQDLSVFFYNEDTTTWEEIESLLDTKTSTISFLTDHFSRYAIGASLWQGVAENVEIKKHLKEYDSKEGTRGAAVRVKNISEDQILGDIRFLITNIDKDTVYLVNNSGTTTDGIPYIDIPGEEYGSCVFTGDEGNIPPSVHKELRKKLLQGKIKNTDCQLIVSQYPDFEEYIYYALEPSKKSEFIMLTFSLPIKEIITKEKEGHQKIKYIPEFKKFEFDVEVQQEL